MSVPHLLTEIRKFIAKHNMPETQFGKLAVNNSHFVASLKNGSEPRAKTEAKVRTFMEGYGK